MEEANLPSSILAKATLRGREYAWAFPDVEEAIRAAQAAGLATLGGQAQFRLPDGICEMYWLEADASDQRQGEAWPTFVRRSAEEVLAKFREKVVGVDYLAEVRSWPVLRDKMNNGENLLASLCFVLSFQQQEPMDRHCCEDMRREVEYVCEQHPDRFDCPDCLVHYWPKVREYGLIVHDGGSSLIVIRFCPWCGTRLPDSLRKDA